VHLLHTAVQRAKEVRDEKLGQILKLNLQKETLKHI